ncbi:MAG: tRNA 2-thiouridine(34) synthase MnmA [Candidatus Pacebacteria bacterium]|nr:tRNA 2-thiouridine(34) synthase MnmA [Candidatus Paceibacterota bacterium]
MKKEEKKKKVYVGMSGGVDSSVAAGLLKKSGYEVLGVHLVCFKGNIQGCSADEDRIEAERAAAALGISFEIWDLEKEYRKKVLNYMIDGYKKGETPNPDVECNKEIKFGIFFERAIKQGADYVATGHYARLLKREGVYKLLAGKDKEKDQSYFLWNLNQKKLAKILFPVGGMLKSEVRKEAKKMRLPNAEKKDSQGLCFIGKVDFQDFLKNKIKEKEGIIKDTEGNILGKHKGIFYYTIGQRKNIGFLGGGGEPYYVVEKKIKKNELIVSRRGEKEGSALGVNLRAVNFISQKAKKKSFDGKIKIRVRYRGKLSEAKIKKVIGKRAEIVFLKPVEFVAMGQSLVAYRGEKELLFGGEISAIHRFF